jgi:hypothetical protein
MRVCHFQAPPAASWPLIATTLSLLAGFAPGAPFQLSRIPDLTTSEDTPTLPVPFSIGGQSLERGVAFLITSSNPAVVPEASVRFSQTESGRNLIITPAANQSGRAVVQLHATEGSITVTQSFSVTVNSINDAPTISRIPDQTISDTTPAALISFTIGDIETPGASLIVTASSSNGALLPNRSLILSGTGASRSLALRPVSGKSGTAMVTVTVNDGDAATSRQFQVTVGTVNRAPLTNAGADQTIVGADATLNGTATDENSQGLLTSWSAVPDSVDVSFANPNALNTTVHFARPGLYTLRLTATDGELSSSDEVTIVVAAPQFAAVKGRAQNRR